MSDPKYLVIIRGVAGTGKSTLAKKVAESNPEWVHLEADMNFTSSYGKYIFDYEYLGFAHNWCATRTEELLQEGKSVIVSNTFTQDWELAIYMYLADKHGYEIVMQTMSNEYGSIHDIDEEIITEQRERYVSDKDMREIHYPRNTYSTKTVNDLLR